MRSPLAGPLVIQSSTLRYFVEPAPRTMRSLPSAPLRPATFSRVVMWLQRASVTSVGGGVRVAGVVWVEVVGVDGVGVIVVGVEVVVVDVAGVTGWTGALRVVPVFGVVTFGRVEGLVIVAAGGVVGVDVVGAGVEVV